MDKLTNFKGFVKQHPELLKHVKNEEMTWQKFYEMYDLYGEDGDTWKSYLNPEPVPTEQAAVAATSALGIGDVLNWLKTADLTKVEESINSVQRVIGVLQDLGTKDSKDETPAYKPRPIYKHFED